MAYYYKLKIYDNKLQQDYLFNTNNIIIISYCNNDSNLESLKKHIDADLLLRTIKFCYPDTAVNVKHIFIITDTNKSTIIKSHKCNLDIKTFNKFKTKQFFENINILGIIDVTTYINTINYISDTIKMIIKLLSNKDAIEKFNKVEFIGHNIHIINSIRTQSNFQNQADQDEFLWDDGSTSNYNAFIYWKSPWGLGRPGELILCATALYKYIYNKNGTLIHTGTNFKLNERLKITNMLEFFPNNYNILGIKKEYKSRSIYFNSVPVYIDKTKYTLKNLYAKGFDYKTIRFYLLLMNKSLKFNLLDLKFAERRLKSINKFINFLYISKIDDTDKPLKNIHNFKLLLCNNLNIRSAVDEIDEIMWTFKRFKIIKYNILSLYNYFIDIDYYILNCFTFPSNSLDPDIEEVKKRNNGITTI